jgi:D-lactate dehydrogenase
MTTINLGRAFAKEWLSKGRKNGDPRSVRGMKILFVDLEEENREFFDEALPEEDVWYCDEIEEVPDDAEVISISPECRVDRAFLEGHPVLRLVTTRSTSLEHIDMDACRNRGVMVRNVASYGDHTVAEHTFALILAITRRLREALTTTRANHFSYAQFRGMELSGKTLGVIGAGRIGRQTLRLGHAFGMRTLAYDMDPIADVARELGFRYVPMEEIFRESDVIALHVPLTPQLHHLLDADAFSQCKRGVIIINTAQGGLIDTEALIVALDSGIVAGAGLDVLEDERVMRASAASIISNEIARNVRESRARKSPDIGRLGQLLSVMHNSALLSRADVVFTPHVAFNTIEAMHRINRCTVEHIRAWEAAKNQALPEMIAPGRPRGGKNLRAG